CPAQASDCNTHSITVIVVASSYQQACSEQEEKDEVATLAVIAMAPSISLPSLRPLPSSI
ncbi:hypothetical protein BgiBS90_029494, partial [Biomphalaria glabrata]